MAQRLFWPRAWALLGVLVAALFGWLEEYGFSERRPPHESFSRWTARFRYAVAAIAIGGPTLSWLYAWHIATIQRRGRRRVD